MALLQEYTNNFRNYFSREKALIIGQSPSSQKFAMRLRSLQYDVHYVVRAPKTADCSALEDAGVDIKVIDGEGNVSRYRKSVKRCSYLIIATESDVLNIDILGELLSDIQRKSESRLNVIVSIKNPKTRGLMVDQTQKLSSKYGLKLRFFDPRHEFAKAIYDRFPPFRFVHTSTVANQSKCIAIVGSNDIAHRFVEENIVLSHFPDEKLKLLFISQNAADEVKELQFRLPHLTSFLELIAIEWQNSAFSEIEDWPGGLHEHLSSVDVLYCFGQQDSEVMAVALRVKQMIYTQRECLTEVPVVACLPEDSHLFDLLEKTQIGYKEETQLAKMKSDFGLHVMRQYSDGIDVDRFINPNDPIEVVARVVNYFYSVSYEFPEMLKTHFRKNSASDFTKNLADKLLSFDCKNHAPLGQIEALILSHLVKYTGSSIYKLKTLFGIEERWEQISQRAKESNRYVARDLKAQASHLKALGVTNFGEAFTGRAYDVLSKLIHDRWMAEKLNADFTYGVLPEKNRKLKGTLKNELKIHDMIIPYDSLSAFEKGKDADMLKMIPLLLRVHAACD
ncbi:MAG: hypothetical protein ACPF83_08185 [Flavobacteriales bacterium]